MATISVTSELDVAEKFAILVSQSLSGESAYIRAKETIQDLVDSGAIDEAQKAETIASIISTISNNITSSSMSTALSWANAEKEAAFKRLELEKQLDILDQENFIKEAQVDEVINRIRLSKIESKRVYGTAIFDGSDNIISLDDTGKVAKDIELTTSQIVKVDKESVLVDQKIKESYAAVHKIIADTYINYGSYTYGSLTDAGITGVTTTHGVGHKTLTDTQKDIAIEQAKGYVYNAWANALTGSASMLGTAIAADLAEFGPDTTGGELLTNVLEIANNLKSASTTVDEAVPI